VSGINHYQRECRLVRFSAATGDDVTSKLLASASQAAPWIAALAGVLGLVLGSFLNVVLYRVPRGMSVAHPGSACPHCGAPVRWFDNLPVVSWIVLRGKCRNCRSAISVVYPVVELATGAIFAGVALGLTLR
jgi:leader peptidase (prepilin peptidase)/N-methyltransferase